jgi:hypothetical protein
MKYAKCNLDGNPISSDDQKVIDTFRIWLRMDKTDRVFAIKLDPKWRKFIFGKEDKIQ